MKPYRIPEVRKDEVQRQTEQMCCYNLEDQTDWGKWILYATFVFNTTPHSSNGFTPHDLLFDRKPNIPGILKRDPPEIRYNYHSYVQELQSRLQSCYELARSKLKAKKERSE